MKNNKENAAKYFNISIEEAKNCNHITLDLMIKYSELINKK
jgi:hypothetical protein